MSEREERKTEEKKDGNTAFDREKAPDREQILNEIREKIESKLSGNYGATPNTATERQMYKVTVLCVKELLTKKRAEFKECIKKQHSKKVYYLCMEFLIGPSLKNNLMNLGLEDEYRRVLADMGFDIEEMYAFEPDPGLGNGGLGRLAACFMDSLSTLNYPATGFSILYEYGLFKQRIIDGNQMELPDTWLRDGDVWLIPRNDKTYTVRFGGHITEKWTERGLEIVNENYKEVVAVPYDIMIPGYDSMGVNNLRLWKAHNNANFNMHLFSQGEYVRAMQENTDAEIISKVLYPSDDHEEGKMLRLSQQYFLVSASLQSIISDHLSAYGTLENFAHKVAIHINDTHPALIVPEIMRVFMDIYSYSWERAWGIVTKVVSYTNHTVMPEALECWNADVIKIKLPRIFMIVEELNRKLSENLWKLYPGDWDRISAMSLIADNRVKMANISVAASHTVNGVSKLHTDILKSTVFKDFYKTTPQKFVNVTNGIAHRRWLCYANPKLSDLVCECIGDGFKKDSAKLSDFLNFQNDKNVLEQLDVIKAENKLKFSKYLLEASGETVDVNSIFDVQVKRIHEYKRQTLNALKIIEYYRILKENPNADIPPCTFIFGGKAAPGYYLAKDIIKLIWSLGEEIKRDVKVRDIIKVIYLEDYRVSTAEILIPATDISEQISLAGKEASGTGCMKFMINGALTLGTLDGANVEMRDAVGKDNIYTFGLNANEVTEQWRRGYDAAHYARNNERIMGVMNMLRGGFAGNSFSNLVNYFIYSQSISDPYMCLADFESYLNASGLIREDYKNRELWQKKALANIAGAGYFSADRSVREYADGIWHISPVKKQV